MEKIFVLDTGAFLSNWTQKYPNAKFITTEQVLDEIRNSPSKMRAENLISMDQLRVESVETETISKVSHAASTTGDVTNLSENDVELIALALSKFGLDLPVTLVSSDYSVLNTANYLGIDILDLTGKMKKAIRWTYECPACKYRGSQSSECPICGTMMRRRARRKKPLK